MAKKSTQHGTQAEPSVNGVNAGETTDGFVEDEVEEQTPRTEEFLNVEELYADDEDEELDAFVAAHVPTSIPIKRPAKDLWLTVCPDPAYSCIVVLYAYKTGQQETTFLVKGKALQREMREDFGAKRRRLYLCMDYDGELFFWPVGLPAQDGTINSWVQSAGRAIAEGKQGWIRVTARKKLQQYKITIAKPEVIPPPSWPTEDMESLLKRAARDCVLEEGDNPILRRLREGA